MLCENTSAQDRFLLTQEKEQAYTRLWAAMDKFGFWEFLGDNKIKVAVEFYHLVFDNTGELTSGESRRLRASLSSVITSDGCPLRRPVEQGGLLEVEQWDDICTIATTRRFDSESCAIRELGERVYWYGKLHHWFFDQRKDKPYSMPKMLYNWPMFKEWLRCWFQPYQAAIVKICNGHFGGFVGTAHLCLIYALDCAKSDKITSGRLILLSVAKCFKTQKRNVWAYPVLPFIWFWNKQQVKKYKMDDWGAGCFDVYYVQPEQKDLVTLAKGVQI